jgi:hypothetical protein
MVSTLARRRRRRTPSLVRGGRFVLRRFKGPRRRHRNPSGFVKVGRRWKKITAYARRRKRGPRRGQIMGYRFPRSYWRRRRVLRNPEENPRRRRYARRGGSSRLYYGRTSDRAVRLSADPIGAIKAALEDAFSMDTLEALFHTSLGFGGVAAGGRLIYKKVIPTLGETSVGRIGTMVGTTILGTTLIGMVTKNRSLTTRFLAGGLLATLWQGLSEALPESAKEFIPTLGEVSPETEEFRKAIEQEVLKELRRGSGMQEYLPAAGAEGVSEYIKPAGVEETYLTPAGAEAYLTPAEGDRATLGAYLTESQTERVAMQPSGIGEPFDEFARASLPERF